MTTVFEPGSVVDVSILGATVSDRHVQDRWLFLILADGRDVHLPLPLPQSVTIAPHNNLGRSAEVGNLPHSAIEHAEAASRLNDRRSLIGRLAARWIARRDRIVRDRIDHARRTKGDER